MSNVNNETYKNISSLKDLDEDLERKLGKTLRYKSLQSFLLHLYQGSFFNYQNSKDLLYLVQDLRFSLSALNDVLEDAVFFKLVTSHMYSDLYLTSLGSDLCKFYDPNRIKNYKVGMVDEK